MNFDKLSRRHFLKKSTILVVATSSINLFSGLTAADEDFYLYVPRIPFPPIPCAYDPDGDWYLDTTDSENWHCWLPGLQNGQEVSCKNETCPESIWPPPNWGQELSVYGHSWDDCFQFTNKKAAPGCSGYPN